MKKIKVAISANCQGGPLGNLLELMSDAVEITHVTIVHRARDDDSKADLTAFKKADFLLAQKVADNYPCHFVRTNALRERFGRKVLSWVNLYYAGYNPEMTYVRGADRAPMNGPLGDYHLRQIIEAYQTGASPKEAAALLTDPDFNAERFAGAGADSLDELKRRDEDADVKIADYVETRLPVAKQFHTFNHPSLDLLTELAARCAAAMGLALNRRPGPGMLPEPLGMIMAPVNPHARLEMGFPPEPAPLTYRGWPFEWRNGAFHVQRGHQLYSVDEMVSLFYRRYDLDPDAISAVQARPA